MPIKAYQCKKCKHIQPYVGDDCWDVDSNMNLEDCKCKKCPFNNKEITLFTGEEIKKLKEHKRKYGDDVWVIPEREIDKLSGDVKDSG